MKKLFDLYVRSYSLTKENAPDFFEIINDIYEKFLKKSNAAKAPLCKGLRRSAVSERNRRNGRA